VNTRLRAHWIRGAISHAPIGRAPVDGVLGVEVHVAMTTLLLVHSNFLTISKGRP